MIYQLFTSVIFICSFR